MQYLCSVPVHLGGVCIISIKYPSCTVSQLGLACTGDLCICRWAPGMVCSGLQKLTGVPQSRQGTLFPLLVTNALVLSVPQAACVAQNNI